MDYLVRLRLTNVRESFWRGYIFRSLKEANRDLMDWLNSVADVRIHGTHRQPILQRWQEERAHLSPLPAVDYDTSLKVFRKVYKDCQLSYEGSRYILPYQVVGKKVLLKIKEGTIRIFDDDRLLCIYEQAQEPHQLVGDPLFYEQLQRDREQLSRKYGRSKGKATRGLSIGSLFPQVMVRPLAEYEQLVQGGGTWTN